VDSSSGFASPGSKYNSRYTPAPDAFEVPQSDSDLRYQVQELRLQQQNLYGFVDFLRKKQGEVNEQVQQQLQEVWRDVDAKDETYQATNHRVSDRFDDVERVHVFQADHIRVLGEPRLPATVARSQNAASIHK